MIRRYGKWLTLEQIEAIPHENIKCADPKCCFNGDGTGSHTRLLRPGSFAIIYQCQLVCMKRNSFKRLFEGCMEEILRTSGFLSLFLLYVWH